MFFPAQLREPSDADATRLALRALEHNARRRRARPAADAQTDPSGAAAAASPLLAERPPFVAGCTRNATSLADARARCTGRKARAAAAASPFGERQAGGRGGDTACSATSRRRWPLAGFLRRLRRRLAAPFYRVNFYSAPVPGSLDAARKAVERSDAQFGLDWVRARRVVASRPTAADAPPSEPSSAAPRSATMQQDPASGLSPPEAVTLLVVMSRHALGALWMSNVVMRGRMRADDGSDEKDAGAITWRTVPGYHVLNGEETFRVHREADTGQVHFTICSVSAPRNPLAWLGWPYTRWCQRRFARDATARMRRVLRQSSETTAAAGAS